MRFNLSCKACTESVSIGLADDFVWHRKFAKDSNRFFEGGAQFLLLWLTNQSRREEAAPPA